MGATVKACDVEEDIIFWVDSVENDKTMKYKELRIANDLKYGANAMAAAENVMEESLSESSDSVPCPEGSCLDISSDSASSDDDMLTAADTEDVVEDDGEYVEESEEEEEEEPKAMDDGMFACP